jgi:glycosyltransferase involved in cell wall biosynthesis
VVPVYNSAATLPVLIDRLMGVLSATTTVFEIIFVNDGSRDNSWDVISGLATQHACLIGINLMRNYGQHNALLCGIRAAQYPIIATLDDDLQHPPEELPKLLSKLAEGYDVVYGTPQSEQHGLWRGVASHLIRLALQSAMGIEVARNVSSFRVFRAEVRRAFADYQSSFVAIDVLLTWGTTRFAAVPVRHEPRVNGASGYTLRKLVGTALNMMTGFSTLPLQVASIIGIFFSLFGVGVLVYVLARYMIHGGSIPGFPFLASVIALFSGAQLFTLGIIGEYLARMYFRSLGRPYSVVRDVIGQQAAEEHRLL